MFAARDLSLTSLFVPHPCLPAHVTPATPAADSATGGGGVAHHQPPLPPQNPPVQGVRGTSYTFSPEPGMATAGPAWRSTRCTPCVGGTAIDGCQAYAGHIPTYDCSPSPVHVCACTALLMPNLPGTMWCLEFRVTRSHADDSMRTHPSKVHRFSCNGMACLHLGDQDAPETGFSGLTLPLAAAGSP
jgi:hypothetical protein